MHANCALLPANDTMSKKETYLRQLQRGTLEMLKPRCVICLESIEKGQMVCRLACAHRFHCACWTQWQAAQPPGTRASCPICRCKSSSDVPVERYVSRPRAMKQGQPRGIERRTQRTDILHWINQQTRYRQVRRVEQERARLKDHATRPCAARALAVRPSAGV